MSSVPKTITETHDAMPPRIIMPGDGPIPRTVEEIKAWAAQLARDLDALDDMGDATEQAETLAFLMEALNADRLSYRARFR